VSPAEDDKEGESDVEKDEKPPPGQTPYERFVLAMKQVLSVSKDELERRERSWRQKRRSKSTKG
jgi:hypothetical protein